MHSCGCTACRVGANRGEVVGAAAARMSIFYLHGLQFVSWDCGGLGFSGDACSFLDVEQHRRCLRLDPACGILLVSDVLRLFATLHAGWRFQFSVGASGVA